MDFEKKIISLQVVNGSQASLTCSVRALGQHEVRGEPARHMFLTESFAAGLMDSCGQATAAHDSGRGADCESPDPDQATERHFHPGDR